MPAKKNPVSTPLHLLQQLSHSLVVHLQKACGEAQRDAEVLLAQLEKQRGKTQEKIVKARAKLDDAGNAGKSKAQTKARAKLAELDDVLAVLQARQSETLSYLAELKRDAEQSLKLAQGVTQVEKAAAQALASREKPATPRAASKAKAGSNTAKPAADVSAGSNIASGKAPVRAARSPARRARPDAAKASAAEKPAEAKTPATKAPSAARPASTAGKPAPAKPASTAAKPAAAKKPAARKPATSRRETADQSSPIAS
ncbi:alginate regulatory protein [Stutzerimonas stutzeri]|uniref:Alginate regulatory protein n=1 Tax=Stutzerimonas stutzeri TaxID=316 RepID=W8R3D7_STUST|nr:AlgP family protein [Stutzerimonas stutzeri]AHL74003.1 alginate regulatory protein [Stutzerimonas stutzeri]MCQ4328473.1 AlgP family protein [Stutzerimonas stutzeri]